MLKKMFFLYSQGRDTEINKISMEASKIKGLWVWKQKFGKQKK